MKMDDRESESSLMVTLRPLLVLLKVMGLYRAENQGLRYMAYASIWYMISLSVMVKSSAGLTGLDPGLSPIYTFMLSAIFFSLQNISVHSIYFYHNIKGSLSALLASLSKLITLSNDYATISTKKWLIKVIVLCLVFNIGSNIFSSGFAYFSAKELKYAMLYPGGKDNYAVDSLVILFCALQGPLCTFTLLMNFVLMRTATSIFTDLQHELKDTIRRDSLNLGKLAEFRQRFTTACDAVSDLDVLLSPCMGITLMIQPAACLFMLYGMVFINPDEIAGVQPGFIYGPVVGWLGLVLGYVTVMAAGGALLNQQVS